MSALHAVADTTVPVLQSLSVTLAASLAALVGSTGAAALGFYLYGRRLRGTTTRPAR